MALIPMTTTVNTQTGAPINSFTVTVNATLEGVVLRKRMCAGAYKYTEFPLGLTIADGSQTTATIPGASPTPISGQGATIAVESSSVTATTLLEGLDFSITGKTITFTTPYLGASKVTTITYDYYDTDPDNLVYDVPVYPSNTKGTITVQDYQMIVWNEGILAQSFEFWTTTGTANGVVHALITDTDV